jgi:hypothetical protein
VPLVVQALLFSVSLYLCGEEVFSIEQLSDESYRVTADQAMSYRLLTTHKLATGD